MVRKKKLTEQYVGPLSPKEIADGMNTARENARRLYADAKLLFDAKRYSSACALAILSVEEAGKPAILRRISGVTDQAKLKNLWREYRTHTAKNRIWIVRDLAMAGARSIDDLKKVADDSSDHPELLDYMKQLAFYTDCYVRGTWATPDEIIERDMAAGILRSARALLGKSDKKHTTREVELWIEHVGPTEEERRSKQRLLSFYQAMIAEGLEDTPIEKVRAFLGLEPRVN